MAKLSEIKLIDATTKDVARALNFAMVKSRKTANVITGKLQLTGPVLPYHVSKKIYPDSTFNKQGLLRAEKQDSFVKNVQSVLNDSRELQDYNMMDYVNAVIKYIKKNS